MVTENVRTDDYSHLSSTVIHYRADYCNTLCDNNNVPVEIRFQYQLLIALIGELTDVISNGSDHT